MAIGACESLPAFGSSLRSRRRSLHAYRPHPNLLNCCAAEQSDSSFDTVDTNAPRYESSKIVLHLQQENFYKKIRAPTYRLTITQGKVEKQATTTSRDPRASFDSEEFEAISHHPAYLQAALDKMAADKKQSHFDVWKTKIKGVFAKKSSTQAAKNKHETKHVKRAKKHELKGAKNTTKQKNKEKETKKSDRVNCATKLKNWLFGGKSSKPKLGLQPSASLDSLPMLWPLFAEDGLYQDRHDPATQTVWHDNFRQPPAPIGRGIHNPHHPAGGHPNVLRCHPVDPANLTRGDPPKLEPSYLPLQPEKDDKPFDKTAPENVGKNWKAPEGEAKHDDDDAIYAAPMNLFPTKTMACLSLPMPSRAPSPEISRNSSINGRECASDSLGSGDAVFYGPSPLRTRAGSYSEIVTKARVQKTEERKKRNRQAFIFPSNMHVGESLIYNGDDAPTTIGDPQDLSSPGGPMVCHSLASNATRVNAWNLADAQREYNESESNCAPVSLDEGLTPNQQYHRNMIAAVLSTSTRASGEPHSGEVDIFGEPIGGSTARKAISSSDVKAAEVPLPKADDGEI